MRLNGPMMDGRCFKVVLVDIIRFRHPLLYIPCLLDYFLDHIGILVDGICPLLQGILRLQVIRQLLVFHTNQLQGLLRYLCCLGCHGCHFVSHIAHGAVKYPLRFLSVNLLAAAVEQGIRRILPAHNRPDPF